MEDEVKVVEAGCDGAVDNIMVAISAGTDNTEVIVEDALSRLRSAIDNDRYRGRAVCLRNAMVLDSVSLGGLSITAPILREPK